MLSDWGLIARQEHNSTIIAFQKDDVDVSFLIVSDCRMHLGRSLVHVGGIGGVETKREARDLGLSRKVMLGTVEWMRERYDMAMLYGIRDFYSKFGFTTCVPEYRHDIRVADAARAVARLAMRPYVPEDRPALMALHAVRIRAWVGSMDRDPERYSPLYRGSNFGRRPKVSVAADADGTVVGYVMYDDLTDRMVIGEVGGERPDVFETITAFAAGAARGRGIGRISLCLPSDEPLVLWARRYGLASRTHYPHDEGCMMRITNLAGACQSLLPEWQTLLPADEPGLCLETDMGTMSLIGGRQATVQEGAVPGLPSLALRQDLLASLIMGYRTVDDVMAEAATPMDGKTAAIATAIFPQRVAYTAGPDRF
jgi:predicted acetyltransferase